MKIMVFTIRHKIRNENYKKWVVLSFLYLSEKLLKWWAGFQKIIPSGLIDE
jgi:hypothetical protein